MTMTNNTPEVTAADIKTVEQIMALEFDNSHAAYEDDMVAIVARHRHTSTTALEAENLRLREKAKRAIEVYAESYETMDRIAGGNGTVDCRSVAYDLRKNVSDSVLAALTTPSHTNEPTVDGVPLGNMPLNVSHTDSGKGEAEPFGYWVEQKHADPVLLRKPAYIPEPSPLRTVTPLYAATPSVSGGAVREAAAEAAFRALAGNDVDPFSMPEMWDHAQVIADAVLAALNPTTQSEGEGR